MFTIKDIYTITTHQTIKINIEIVLNNKTIQTSQGLHQNKKFWYNIQSQHQNISQYGVIKI